MVPPPSGRELLLTFPPVADIMVQCAPIGGGDLIVAYLVSSPFGYPLLVDADAALKKALHPGVTPTEVLLKEVSRYESFTADIQTHLRKIEGVLEGAAERGEYLISSNGNFLPFPAFSLRERHGFYLVDAITNEQKDLLESTVSIMSFAHLYVRFY